MVTFEPIRAQAGPRIYYEHVTVHVDGRGEGPNDPGKWAVAFFDDDGRMIRSHVIDSVEPISNNIAEYNALILGLEMLLDHSLNIGSATILSDSQLIVYQVNSKWECLVKHLKEKLEEVRRLQHKARSSQLEVEIKWIRRKENRADQLMRT